VSRIHDALRGGRVPGQPSSGRTAHADAVLAALGYRPGQARRWPNVGIVVGLVALGAAILGVWWSLPMVIAPKPATVGAHAPHPSPPAARPADRTLREPSLTRPAAPAQTTQALPPKPAAVTVREQPAPTVTPQSEKRAIDVAPRPQAVPAREPPANTEPVVPRPVPPSETSASAKADEFKLALYYQRTGDFELALVHYKTVLQRDEMNADARNNLGNLYMSKALYEDAAREFRRVVAIEPKYVTAHVNLSAALYQLKRYDESAAEARAAIRLDGRSADAYVNLALALSAAGQPSDARSSLSRALEIDRHNAAAHYNLALEYEKAGEVALALDHYRAFLQYAGPEQAGYAADVRSRMQTLEHK
jgi:Tfp pilus assembly protein PilF